jgi:bifunctional DNase/RNase
LQDAVLDRVEGDDWWAAKLHIVKDGHLVGLDVRASDAFIVAAIAGVPVFVDDIALERYADRG